MKKITGSLFIAAVLFLTSLSCKKECEREATVTKVIPVSLKVNESYSSQIPQTGDADDVMQIIQQAMHFSTSKVSSVANSENSLFEYTPAPGYSGTDEVQISNVEGPHNNGNGGPHPGNCNGGKNHHGETVYIFKITVANPIAYKSVTVKSFH